MNIDSIYIERKRFKFLLRPNVRNIKTLYAIFFGITGAIWASKSLFLIWPLLVVYGTLIWKEYAVYEPLPGGRMQINTVLSLAMRAIELLTYVFLAASLQHPRLFILFMIIFLFIEVVVHWRKYARQRPHTLSGKRLRMDSVEFVLALFSLIAIYDVAYTQIVLILWGLLATDTTIYFLIFRNVSGAPYNVQRAMNSL